MALPSAVMPAFEFVLGHHDEREPEPLLVRVGVGLAEEPLARPAHDAFGERLLHHLFAVDVGRQLDPDEEAALRARRSVTHGPHWSRSACTAMSRFSR